MEFRVQGNNNTANYNLWNGTKCTGLIGITGPWTSEKHKGFHSHMVFIKPSLQQVQSRSHKEAQTLKTLA